MKKFITVLIVTLLLIGSLVGCSSRSSHDDIMSSYDWGPDHYYDSGSHSVEKKPWK